MTFRAVALGNDDTTVPNATSFTITVPATVQAGDVLLVVAAENSDTATFTITGGGTGSAWTAQSGPDDNTGVRHRTYLWSKTATASSASSTVTVTTSVGGRFVGILTAHSGVTEAGLLVGLTIDQTVDADLAFASAPIPDASGWSLVGLGSLRVAAAVAATVTAAPAGSVIDGQSNTAVASPNYTAIALHKTATVGVGAQSLGTATASAAVADNLYTVGLAPAGAVTIAGATATGTAQANAGEALGSGATAQATATAHAGVAMASSQDETVAGATAAATATAHAGLASQLAIATSVEPGNVPPRVRIDIADARPTPLTAVTVLRVDPDGRRVPVRTTDGNAFTLTASGSNRLGTLYDYEAPFGQRVTYTLAENPQTESPVTLDVDQVWLIHPGVPSRSMPIRVTALQKRTRQVKRGVFYPLGSEFPVVNTDGRRKAPEGVLEVRTETDSDRVAMDALLDDAQTLFLNVPAGKQWGVTTMYVAIDTTSEARFIGWGPHPYRNWELPYTATRRPAGGAQAQRNLQDIKDSYATLQDVKDAYATLADLQANIAIGA